MGLKSQFEGGNMENMGEIFFRINKYHDHVGFFKVKFTFASLARPPVVRRFAHKNNLVILLII